MTGAYAAFASGGYDGAPWAIREIRVRGDDAPLMQAEPTRRRVVDARVAGRMTAMLEAVVREGTGARAALPDRPRRARPAPPRRRATRGSSASRATGWWASGWAMTTTRR
jgi:penicillin-binding protein 1A